jgi:hypothetical protein
MERFSAFSSLFSLEGRSTKSNVQSYSRAKIIALFLAALLVLLLLAFLGYRSSLSLPFTRTYLFINHSSPPEYIIKVFPVPGEIIHEEKFNNQAASYSLSYGYVCFFSYTNELSGAFGEDKRINKNFQFTINDKDTIGFWEGERNWVGRFVTLSEDMQAAILTVCWNVILVPGEYLAKLKYEVNDTISVFNWAFRVIED